MKRFATVWLGLVLPMAMAMALAPVRARSEPLIVFAAASLKNALDEVGASFAKTSGKPAPRASYAGSPALARQIEQGAPADIFISADSDWMDYLEKRNLVRPSSRDDLLGNAIVVVAPASSATALPAVTGPALRAAMAGGRIALADVNAVPAGKYARAALERLGAWEVVKDRVAQSENVRAALLFVARGEAPLGIVYRTDAAAEPRVKIVATLPADSHPPIVYPVAVTTASKNPDADAFLSYLRGPQARAAFEKQGFIILQRSSR